MMLIRCHLIASMAIHCVAAVVERFRAAAAFRGRTVAAAATGRDRQRWRDRCIAIVYVWRLHQTFSASIGTITNAVCVHHRFVRAA